MAGHVADGQAEDKGGRHGERHGAPPAAPRRQPGHDPPGETGRGVDLGGQEQQAVGGVGQLVQVAPAIRAAVQVRQDRRALVPRQRAQGQLRGQLLHVRTRERVHGDTEPWSRRPRSLIIPARILVLAVPSGMPSMSAISLAVRP